MHKFIKPVLAAVALCTGLLTVTSVSAAIACNREGECWHVKARYAYHPEFGVVIHENNWRWGAAEKYRWREHSGRGYWRNGIWIRF
jgi:hypothetical protein